MSKTVEVRQVAIVGNLLVTARDDGTVSINAQVLARIEEASDEVKHLIVNSINAALKAVE